MSSFTTTLFNFSVTWLTIWLAMRVAFGKDSKLLKAYTDLSKRCFWITAHAIGSIFKHTFKAITKDFGKHDDHH